MALAVPLAGTAIQNQAMVTYHDDGTSSNNTLGSNITTVYITASSQHELQTNLSVNAPRLSSVNLAHSLHNRGNAKDSYTLVYANQTGDNFDLNNLRMFADENRNGLLDAGEAPLANGASVNIEAGKSVHVVIVGEIPATPLADELARIELVSTASSNGQTAINTDLVRIASSSLVQVSSQMSPTLLNGGDNFTLSTQIKNTGTANADGLTAIIDGTPQSKLIIETQVPANSEFINVINIAGGNLLFHIAGNPALTYQSTVPTDLTLVDQVVVAFDRLIPDVAYTLSFNFRLKLIASKPIQTSATVRYYNSASATVVVQQSNLSQIDVPYIVPSLNYYTDNTYSAAKLISSVGDALFAEVSAGQCNQDSSTIENVTLIIDSKLTGDSESFLLTESAANSGLFRFVPNIPTVDASVQATVRGNGQLELRTNDKLNAQLQACGENVILASLLIDPYGIVFDSKSGVAIPGATITLIDVTGSGNGGNAGGLAIVFQEDGLTPSPNPVVSSATGAYAFPLVASSTYRLMVSPPPGFGFPSSLPPALLPTGFVVNSSASYGGDFIVSAATGPVRVDLPMDGAAAAALSIKKTTSAKNVDLGGFVDYNIEVSNTSGSLLQGLSLTDSIPKGFAYVVGSTRIDGISVADPSGGRGPILSFSLADMVDGTTINLRYRLVVGPRAKLGKAINVAQAQSALPLVFVSNTSSAAVNVQRNIFSQEGFIIGKVFLDCNGNAIQESEELGIPGVHLLMENGNYVVTDGAGQYSFYGISAKTHVLKIDASTLPFGIDSAVLSNRHADDPLSRFVDMKRGELHKANFPLFGCEDEKVKMIMGRRVKSKALVGESTQRITQSLPLVQEQGEIKSSLVSGTIDNNKPPVYEPIEKSNQHSERSYVPIDTSDLALDKQMANMNNNLAFVNINKGDTYPVKRINVQIKGRQGSRFKLLVNGIHISNKRVGKRSVMASRQLLLWEYVGIKLRSGQNILVAHQLDAFGNIRETVKSFVIAPGELGKIHLSVKKRKLVANGGMVRIKVRITDNKNRQISARIPITLSIDRGNWMLIDLDQETPGHQVFLEKGEGEFVLKAPTVPGRAQLEVSTGRLQSNKQLDFLPHLRPLFAVGMVEGAINLRNLDSIEKVKQSDGFAEELRGLSLGNDKANARGRAAFFLKGKIKGEYLLSMRYDSQREKQDTLFRDIQADKYYPVYGDSSIKGFEAQSTSKLFVRIDKNRSYILYGDYATQLDHPARKLSRYQRNLNGIKHHFENEKVKLDLFSSYESSNQVVEEIPAQGVSGPYRVNVLDAVENSERIEIIVRDRNQPSVVLQQSVQNRFRDYQFNAYTGEIAFKSPIASVDANLNPVFIRITYEVQQGGRSYWATGLSAEYKFNSNLELGVDVINDRSPIDSHHVYAANLSARIGAKTTLGAEIVQTQRDSMGDGLAHRLDLRHKGEQFSGNISYGQADVEFYNPSASLNRGRGELRAQASYRANAELSFKGDIIHSKDKFLGGSRNGVDLSSQYNFPYQIKTEVGIRHVSESKPADTAMVGVSPNEFTSIRARLSNQLPILPSLSLFGEYEQSISGEGNRAAAGGEYTLGRMGRIYAHHEFISSLGNPYSLNGLQQRNLSVIGVDSKYQKNARVYSEYRVREAVSGREAQAAMGLRHRWLLWNNVGLQAGLERIQSFSGTDRDSTAINAALNYTASEFWKMSNNMEFRFSSQSDSFHNSLGLAKKLDDRWSLLARNNIYTTDFVNGDYRLKERFQLGLAYRQKQWYRWHGFGKYEYKLEKEDVTNQMLKRDVHLLSTHINYQPYGAWILSGRFASKWVNDSSNGLSSESQANLLGGRVLYEFNQKWDLGSQFSVLKYANPKSMQTSFGVEIGRILAKNLWASLGLNFHGYSDKDFQTDEYTEAGLYFRLRYKFDEKLIDNLAHKIRGGS